MLTEMEKEQIPQHSEITTNNAAIPPINAFHFCVDRIKQPNQKHKYPTIIFIMEKLKNLNH